MKIGGKMADHAARGEIGTEGPARYGRVAIGLHWSVVLGLVGTVVLALYLATLDSGDSKDALLGIHKSLGVIIFLLMIGRLTWRHVRRPPPLPSMPHWQQVVARVTHWLLYLTVIAMPVSGYVSVAARGRETIFLGLVSLPRWVPLSRSLSHDAERLHFASQYALYGLVAAHIGAALYHHFVMRDGLLSRMWPSQISERR